MTRRRVLLLTANLILLVMMFWVFNTSIEPTQLATLQTSLPEEKQDTPGQQDVVRVPTIKPLFKVQASPLPTAVPIASPPEKLPFRLIGIAADKGQGVAVVQHISDGQITRIKPDNTVLGWRLIRLSRTEIELSHASGQAVLRLHDRETP